ncbi:MAG TPA: hypothetical protein VLB90_06750 [Pseudomonadales bacterium]|nr:hypothetical protein [Pseudomonadales bacterium]
MLLYASVAFGRWYPSSDEWNVIPFLLDDTKFTAAYVWLPHNEHRLVLPKLIWKLMYPATGADYRFFTCLNTSIYILASVYLLRCLRNQAGKNRLTDLAIPLLLLSGAQGVHYWGFELQAAMSNALLMSLMAAVLVCACLEEQQKQKHRAAVMVVAGCLVALTLTGVNGVIPATTIAICLLFSLAHRHSAHNSMEANEKILAAASCTALLIAFLSVQGIKSAGDNQNPTLRQVVTNFYQVMSSSAGELNPFQHWIFILAFTVYAACSLLLLGQLALRKSAHGNSALTATSTLLGVFAAAASLPLAVAFGRNTGDWSNDQIYHYSPYSVPAIFAIIMIISLAAKPAQKNGLLVGILAFSLFVQLHNFNLPLEWGKSRASTNNQVRALLSEGGCIEDILQKNIAYFYFVQNDWAIRTVGKGMLTLKKYGIPEYQNMHKCKKTNEQNQ